MKRAALLAILLVSSCKKESLPVSLPYEDTFDRQELGPNWSDPAGVWRISGGELTTAMARNNCAWLLAALPEESVAEFECRSETPDGDLKFIAHGDGREHDSGYSLIFGGWKNSLSIIARLGEHTPDRLEKADKVEIGRKYRFKMVKRGKHVRWFIDGKAYLDFFDADPLSGKGHDRFGFCDWDSRVFFDNLKLRAAVGMEEEEKALPR